jgi:hypothetical protein
MLKPSVAIPHNLVAEEWDLSMSKPYATPYYLKEDLPDPTYLPVKLALRSKEHSEVPNKLYFEKFIQYNHLSFKPPRRRRTANRGDRLLNLKRKQYDVLFVDPELRSQAPYRADSPVQRAVRTASSRNPQLLKISRIYEKARRESLNYSLISEARQRVKDTDDQISSRFRKA